MLWGGNARWGGGALVWFCRLHLGLSHLVGHDGQVVWQSMRHSTSLSQYWAWDTSRIQDARELSLSMVTSSNENIQSSELGCHFGHYKAASYDRYLSVMHAAKLTLTASPGIPLARWGNGLMVLLEKVFGNIYIDKMQESVFLRPITTGSTSLYSLN